MSDKLIVQTQTMQKLINYGHIIIKKKTYSIIGNNQQVCYFQYFI